MISICALNSNSCQVMMTLPVLSPVLTCMHPLKPFWILLLCPWSPPTNKLLSLSPGNSFPISADFCKSMQIFITWCSSLSLYHFINGWSHRPHPNSLAPCNYRNVWKFIFSASTWLNPVNVTVYYCSLGWNVFYDFHTRTDLNAWMFNIYFVKKI